MQTPLFFSFIQLSPTPTHTLTHTEVSKMSPLFPALFHKDCSSLFRINSQYTSQFYCIKLFGEHSAITASPDYIIYTSAHRRLTSRFMFPMLLQRNYSNKFSTYVPPFLLRNHPYICTFSTSLPPYVSHLHRICTRYTMTNTL